MRMAESLLRELEAESEITRRVLERVPDAHLEWRPHAKSRTVGQLVMHLAENAGSVAEQAVRDSADFSGVGNESVAKSVSHALAVLDESVARAKQLLAPLTDEQLHAEWRAVAGGVEVMAMPRLTFLRTALLNHWYHHRGQLTVYLRMLDVPLPSVYGPSADENPFLG